MPLGLGFGFGIGTRIYADDSDESDDGGYAIAPLGGMMRFHEARPASRAGPADYAVLANDGRERPASRRKNSL